MIINGKSIIFQCKSTNYRWRPESNPLRGTFARFQREPRTHITRTFSGDLITNDLAAYVYNAADACTWYTVIACVWFFFSSIFEATRLGVIIILLFMSGIGREKIVRDKPGRLDRRSSIESRVSN